METLKRNWNRVPKIVRQTVIILISSVVLLAGIVMLVTPGPGWVTIFLGLAILATEFAWAKQLRDWIINKFKSAYKSAKSKKKTKQ